MKKMLLVICTVLSMLASNAFAQEVRGCTTRRVVYESSSSYSVPFSSPSNKYYGWEITNHNSFKVNVDVLLYTQNGLRGSFVVKTQSIILKPQETYIFKREEHQSTWVNNQDSDHPISGYYVDYKAYKIN